MDIYNLYTDLSPNLKAKLTFNGVVLVHVIASQFIYCISFWSVALFFIDLFLFIVPLILNVLFLFGTEKVRDFFTLSKFRFIVDLYLFVECVFFLIIFGYCCWGLSKILLTEFLGILMIAQYLLILALCFGQALHIISFKVLLHSAAKVSRSRFQHDSTKDGDKLQNRK